MNLRLGWGRKKRTQDLGIAVLDALDEIGYDARDCTVTIGKPKYARVPRWMGRRKHEIWHVTIHGWNPEKKSWRKYPGVVATRIHCLLAQKGFVTRVRLNAD